jgi:hypothetical protein
MTLVPLSLACAGWLRAVPAKPPDAPEELRFNWPNDLTARAGPALAAAGRTR